MGNAPFLMLYGGTTTLESALTIFYETKDMFPIKPRNVTPFTQEKWKIMWCVWCGLEMPPPKQGHGTFWLWRQCHQRQALRCDSQVLLPAHSLHVAMLSSHDGLCT